MPKFTLTIEADDPSELAAFLPPAPVTAPAPKKKKAAAKKTEAAPAAPAAPPADADHPAEAPAEATAPAVPEMDQALLTKKVAAFIEEHGEAGGSRVVAALANFKAKKISDLKPAKYGEFIQEFQSNA